MKPLVTVSAQLCTLVSGCALPWQMQRNGVQARIGNCIKWSWACKCKYSWRREGLNDSLLAWNKSSAPYCTDIGSHDCYTTFSPSPTAQLPSAVRQLEMKVKQLRKEKQEIETAHLEEIQSLMSEAIQQGQRYTSHIIASTMTTLYTVCGNNTGLFSWLPVTVPWGSSWMPPGKQWTSYVIKSASCQPRRKKQKKRCK